MARNLGQPDGFYAEHGAAGRHFATSAGRELYAVALLELLCRVDRALGRPDRLDLVDIGAGDGGLLHRMHRLAPPHLAGRLICTAVELSAAPHPLPGWLTWTNQLPSGVTGLITANEWLDTQPVQVVVDIGTGPRVVEVDPAGRERLAGRPTEAESDWLARHWPLTGPGSRAEVGVHRDTAWSRAVAALDRGAALAVDYPVLRPGHGLGTLTGFRAGREVRPVPDGNSDITAAVVFGSVAAAGAATAGAATAGVAAAGAAAAGVAAAPPGTASTRQMTQRRALPGLWRGGADATGGSTAHRLALHGQAAELCDRAGLGAHRWLCQTVGICGRNLLGGPDE